MPILQVQDEFQSGDNVTATSLNNLVEQASFDSGAVDNATLQIDTLGSGYLKVKDNGILSNHLKSDASDTNDAQRAVTTNHIRNDAVTNAKIANLAVDTEQIAADAVTYAKMQNVSATDRVLGRDSAGAGNVEEITPTALRTMINVEDGATADQTASEIKTAYESNSDTNVFTDAEKTKLTGIEAGATADQTASEIKTAYESNSDTNVFTDAEKSKLTGIEAGATADQTASEIKTAYESNSDTNVFTDAEKTKLTGIEAGAEVNPGNATTSASGLMSSTDKTKLNGIATSANNYSHPTGDGNLHVPATGTTNEGKILTAGATAGSISWETAPGQSVTEGTWTLANIDHLNGNWTTGSSSATMDDVVKSSRLYYHRMGRLVVLSGTINFERSASKYFRTNYSTGSNYMFISFDNPTDSLAVGGTAKIYPIGIENPSGTGNGNKKMVGHGFAEWFGDTSNTSTSTPQRYGGKASCDEDPGGYIFTNNSDQTELTLQNAPNNWYIGGVFFEYSFLLDPAFA